MRVLITGAKGFIGRNLDVQLTDRGSFEISRYDRESTETVLVSALRDAEFVCHLAGVNRPREDSEFATGNPGLTEALCEGLVRTGRPLPVIFASSVHALQKNAYGASKLAAEEILLDYSRRTGVPVYIFRLPHVIGKWCRPNYNSVVATFCHNIARGLPIEISDADRQLSLVHVDDVVDTFAALMTGALHCGPYCEAGPSYAITVGELASVLRSFKSARETLTTDRVGSGLLRVLHSTYMSYLPPEQFVYPVPRHSDARGDFVEMLKTPDSGQMSFFTAPPGVTRGGHYHHAKTEKFLVVQGTARFRFRNIVTDQRHEIVAQASRPEIVETVPGWAHDLTNEGAETLIVMLWSNEVFDPKRPDTYSSGL